MIVFENAPPTGDEAAAIAAALAVILEDTTPVSAVAATSNWHRAARIESIDA